MITFNYDMLIEHALRSALGRPPDRWYSPNQGDRFALYKPHGSLNWGRLIDGEWLGRGGLTDAADERLIEAANEWWLQDEEFGTVLYPPDDVRSNVYRTRQGQEAAGVPFLAAPLKRKAEFACPPFQLKGMTDALRSMTRLITIGWRAQEPHFLRLLAESRRGVDVPRLIVTRSPVGADAVSAQLSTTGILGQEARVTGKRAFTQLVRDGELETFLGS